MQTDRVAARLAPFLSLLLAPACGGSTPVGGGTDGGAAVADGGASPQDGGAGPVDGGAETLTPEAIGRLAFGFLQNNNFTTFYSRLVARPAEVKAACPGLSGVDAYFSTEDGSQPAQQSAFNECRSRLNITQLTLAEVRVATSVPALTTPACNGPVPRHQVTVVARTGSGTEFHFTLGDVMTFTGAARVYGKLKDCGSAASLADGGPASPVVAISAAPAAGTAGQPTDFSAAITSGTPPYSTCAWRFLAGDNPIAGALAGNTCTGRYTHPQGGDFTVSIEVGDSANRVGRNAITFHVNAGGGGGPLDLIVRGGSLRTVNPPAENKYAPGSNIEVELIAKNIGAGDAPATTVRVLLHDPSVAQMVPDATLGDVAINALASGQEQSVRRTFMIASNQSRRVYDLVAQIDPEATTNDANRGNNSVTFLWVDTR